MEPNSIHTRIHGVMEITLARAAQCGLLSYGALARSCMVSKTWQIAGGKALPMLVHLDFRGHEARVTGRDVLCALVRLAGASLRSVSLADCREISGPEAEMIQEEILYRLVKERERSRLSLVAQTCPKVEIHVSKCTLEVAVRTFAVLARNVLSAACPLKLYAAINALPHETFGDRIEFEDLRSHLELNQNQELPGPHIVLERGLLELVETGAPGEDDESDDPNSNRLKRLQLKESLKRLLLKEARHGNGSWRLCSV